MCPCEKSLNVLNALLLCNCHSLHLRPSGLNGPLLGRFWPTSHKFKTEVKKHNNGCSTDNVLLLAPLLRWDGWVT